MTKKVLITGGNGFVGHHIIEHILKNTDWIIYNIDKLSYSSNGFDRLRDIEAFDEKRVNNFAFDLINPLSYGLKKEIGNHLDYILNVAAESHVDNSIKDPVNFINNNINSTLNLLEYNREMNSTFIQFSTDECYGSAPEGVNYKEGDRHNPGNPYSASKSACESIVRSYANTYKMRCMITNGMNILGERQHPEKFLPLVINKILYNQTLEIHSNKEKTKAGSRFYIHARNVADAILFIINNVNETLDPYDAGKGCFNIVGEKELDNLQLAKIIEKYVKKHVDNDLKWKFVDFHSSRPGHDLRYALDGNKLKILGWEPPKTIEETIEKIVDWYFFNDNRIWLLTS